MLNYLRLKALQPTIYKELVNHEGQKIQLVEHPIQGDTAPVVVMFPDLEQCAFTDFWDAEDFYTGSEYLPVYQHGTILSAWEVGYMEKKQKVNQK